MKYTKEQWFKLVDDHEASNMSVLNYCRSVGITPSSFYKYKKIHNHHHATFMPIVIVQEAPLQFICNGFEFEVNPNIDYTALSLLLKAAKYD